MLILTTFFFNILEIKFFAFMQQKLKEEEFGVFVEVYFLFFINRIVQHVDYFSKFIRVFYIWHQFIMLVIISHIC